MMKSKLTVKKAIPFAIAFVLLAFYLFIQGPVKTRIEELQLEQADVETDVILLQPKITQMNLWKKELNEISESGDAPKALPDYDNIENIIDEMNDIFEGVTDYRIVFSDVTIENSIVTRNMAISFTCSDYDALYKKIQKINDSEYRYQIQRLEIETKGNTLGSDWGFESSNTSAVYSVEIELTAYEYSSEN